MHQLCACAQSPGWVPLVTVFNSEHQGTWCMHSRYWLRLAHRPGRSPCLVYCQPSPQPWGVKPPGALGPGSQPLWYLAFLPPGSEPAYLLWVEVLTSLLHALSLLRKTHSPYSTTSEQLQEGISPAREQQWLMKVRKRIQKASRHQGQPGSFKDRWEATAGRKQDRLAGIQVGKGMGRGPVAISAPALQTGSGSPGGAQGAHPE
jgi:hypothetical protein